ncbi:hypothetical protein ACGE24_03050 [Corynebacterium kroppenstedtii]|uniref:hypothetical protein n=1 Tax=Corynebacterium sp. PCR 32 TaxID=3351342 RepID=UPI0030A76FFF
MIILYCGREAQDDHLIRAAVAHRHHYRLIEVDEIPVPTDGNPVHSSNHEPVAIVHSATDLSAVLNAVHCEKSVDDTHDPTVIIPMTAGRDLHSITVLAQAVLWWKRSNPAARIIISRPIGNRTTRVSALRANMRSNPALSYVIFSVALDPFFDADLFRDARLAWQYGHADISVAFDGAAPSLSKAIHHAEIILDDACARNSTPGGKWPRCMETTAPEIRVSQGDSTTVSERIVVVRADLMPATDNELHQGGQKYREVPLWTPSALAVLIEQNIADARADLSGFDSQDTQRAHHGERTEHYGRRPVPVIGMEAALWADHDSGFAHSHGDDDGHHTHSHHHHPHTHMHSHKSFHADHHHRH